MKQIDYMTAPLRFSDHRPVYATFYCTVNDIDEGKKQVLSEEIFSRRRLEVGDNTANSRYEDPDDDDLIGYDPIAPELPPASSDRQKWWLDNGKWLSMNLSSSNSSQDFPLDQMSKFQTMDRSSILIDLQTLLLMWRSPVGSKAQMAHLRLLRNSREGIRLQPKLAVLREDPWLVDGSRGHAVPVRRLMCQHPRL